MIKKLIFLLMLCCCPLTAATKPDLLLAGVYRDNIDVQQYWVSEKLDGVRAYWDGKQLISRGGNVIAAPAWFVAGFPPQALDGELWLGRNKFAETLSIVSKQQPVDSEWQQIRYYLFELPQAAGSFTERINALQRLVAQQNSRYLMLVPQFRLADNAQLMARLHQLERAGAEGLMLHHQDALYKTGRSHDLLKLKSYQDSEAEVIGYRPGKGKYQGMVGALVVKTPEGKTFAIGSGLTDELRQTPPRVGAVVTYRYNGLTKHGLPRFARFLHVHQPF
ncbi:DNA ligase [Rheinheimera baltica]|uniref:DNA ligase n=1 Tax=Rheinheimera baltica TaxID=67576 RepID=A0ABT9I4E9_9GAMM|nr:DNA ligase [Rheinheimera baltica]MDP5138281.1 DNA ligase [Rheinheimera baltica]MDP5150432.1 DNA ligase [Rheinheimera baltica]